MTNHTNRLNPEWFQSPNVCEHVRRVANYTWALLSDAYTVRTGLAGAVHCVWVFQGENPVPIAVGRVTPPLPRDAADPLRVAEALVSVIRV